MITEMICTPEFLASLFKPGTIFVTPSATYGKFVTVTDGLPDGACFVGIILDFARDQVRIQFAVPDGSENPTLVRLASHRDPPPALAEAVMFSPMTPNEVRKRDGLPALMEVA